MAICETVKVERKDAPDGFIIINKSDLADTDKVIDSVKASVSKSAVSKRVKRK